MDFLVYLSISKIGRQNAIPDIQLTYGCFKLCSMGVLNTQQYGNDRRVTGTQKGIRYTKHTLLIIFWNKCIKITKQNWLTQENSDLNRGDGR